MPKDASPPAKTDLSFEEALMQLEEIVALLEDDPPDLEAALAAYEEGTALARQCQRRLEAAELRVEELSLE